MNLAQKVERDQKRCAEVVDAAEALVALWNAHKISGCTRAERNSAIDETRTRLTEAVGALHAD
jgi:hypothetical protein